MFTFKVIIGFFIGFIALPPILLLMNIFKKTCPFNRHKNRINSTILKAKEDGKIDWIAIEYTKEAAINKPGWPPVLNILGYLLTFIIILGGMFFTLALGVTLGNDKTYQWMTSMISSILTSILVAQPIMVSMIFTYYPYKIIFD